MARPVTVDVLDGLIDPFDAFDRDLGAKILGLPIRIRRTHAMRCRDFTRGDGERDVVAMQQHARTGQISQHRRKELIGYRAIDEQRLGRVAHPETTALRVHDDVVGHGKLGAFVHVHVAVAGSRLDDGNLRALDAMANQTRPSTRDEHVDDAMKLHEGIGCRAIGRGDGAHRVGGKPDRGDRLGENPRDGLVRADREAASAQDDGVARLQANTRRVGGDVRSGLVDHRHNPERHADARELDAVVQRRGRLGLAEGIGQRDQFLQSIRHGADAGLVEHETIEQRVARPRLARGVHIARVRLHDTVRVGAQRPCHSEKRVVAFSRARGTQDRARVLRPLGERPHLILNAHETPSLQSARQTSSYPHDTDALRAARRVRPPRANALIRIR